MADQLLTGTTLVENTSRSQGDVPIGGVIPWLKSFTGVYSYGVGWVECNGQVLNDPQSSLNGQTIPNLNGNNNFLRGNATSGGTGGTATHSHVSPVSWDSDGGGVLGITNINGISSPVNSGGYFCTDDGATGGGTRDNYNTSSSATIPPYYNVVFIMRVR